MEAIREYICLRKVNAKEYKDATAKENIWKEVVRKVSKILPKQMKSTKVLNPPYNSNI